MTMPRGRPKPPGACERTGCYKLAAATVRIWHDKMFGYRSATIELCDAHAHEYDYEPGEIHEARNGSRTTWYRDFRP